MKLHSWMGKKIEDMSREELIAALEQSADMYQASNEQHARDLDSLV